MLSQALLASVDRDALSGWGAVVHVMYVLNFRRGQGIGISSSRLEEGEAVLSKHFSRTTTTAPQKASPRGRSRPGRIKSRRLDETKRTEGKDRGRVGPSIIPHSIYSPAGVQGKGGGVYVHTCDG